MVFIFEFDTDAAPVEAMQPETVDSPFDAFLVHLAELVDLMGQPVKGVAVSQDPQPYRFTFYLA